MNAFKRFLAGCAVVLACSIGAEAQLVSQSELTKADIDPDFKLTLDHLSYDSRWLGLSPRSATWSPDGETVYFRWREDPASGQNGATDPWFAVDRAGTEVRSVDTDEALTIPSGGIQWSPDRSLAAWSRSGTLFLWSEDAGTRAVYTAASNLGNLHMARDASRIFFGTRGFGGTSPDSSGGRSSGDLWAYGVEDGYVRLIATAGEKEEEPEPDSAEKWLQDQQLELIDIVRQRKNDREESAALAREREPYRPQVIPVEKGARIYNIRLSPDGEHLTFQWIKRGSEGQRTQFLEFVNESGQAEAREARPKVGDPVPEYKMGIVRVDPLADTDDIEVTWVDGGVEQDTVLHGPYWSPTGDTGVVQILSMDHKDRWISRLDVETGQTALVHHEHQDDWIGGPLVGGRWNPGYLQWLADGSAFGFVSEETGWAMLYLADGDGNVQRLTDGEFEVRGSVLGPDGRWYLTTSQEHPGETHLYGLDAEGGDLERLTIGEGRHTSILSPDGGRIAILYQSPLLLSDLYLMDTAAGASRQRITKSGTDDYYRYDWIDSEIISFPDANGEETWAKVWEQPAEQNGAGVIHIHGCGECAQGVTKGWQGSAGVYANYLYQSGFTSASLDYAGSSGYGHQNRTYAYRQMGVSDIDSGLPLLDILADRYGVDRDRIGLYGGSYGGFFTIMSLFRHPGEYRAGVALYPVTDWAHYNQGYTSRILNGTPQSDEEAYRVSSPVYYAEGLEDHLQIQHGLVDNNVQIQDSFRLSQMLMEMGKDFDLVVYPMEDHGWDEIPSRRDSYRRMTAWFDRYLLADDGSATTQQRN